MVKRIVITQLGPSDAEISPIWHVRLVAATLACLAIVVLFPAGADGRIVLGAGAANVRLGDTGKTVRAVLGKPRTIQRYEGGQSWFFSGYWLTLDTDLRVIGIEVKHPSQKTNRGIGLGSSYAAFRRVYGRANCHSDAPFDRVYRICSLRVTVSGKAVQNRFVFLLDRSLALIDIGDVGEFA